MNKDILVPTAKTPVYKNDIGRPLSAPHGSYLFATELVTLVRFPAEITKRNAL